MPITYDRRQFFACVRDGVFAGFLSAKQVAGCGAILDAWEACQPDGDSRFLAYMLATAKWETASTMQPIEEYGHGRGRAYGHPVGPWHQVYDGRGDVQLTWEANYKKATARLRALGALGADVDLERTPDLAMRPDIAADIMIFGMTEGWFTGKALADFFDANGTDWVGARRIINGTDHADDVATLARGFHTALVTAKAVSSPKPKMPPAAGLTERLAPLAPPPKAAPTTPAPRPGVFARIAHFFGRH